LIAGVVILTAALTSFLLGLDAAQGNDAEQLNERYYGSNS